MKFTYQEDSGHIAITTDHGLRLEILFTNNAPDEIYIDGYEFTMKSDSLKGICFMIDEKFYTAMQVIELAEEEFPAIMKEVEADRRAEDNMARELSCPAATGRI